MTPSGLGRLELAGGDLKIGSSCGSCGSSIAPAPGHGALLKNEGGIKKK
jgi:hypothetical protein